MKHDAIANCGPAVAQISFLLHELFIKAPLLWNQDIILATCNINAKVG